MVISGNFERFQYLNFKQIVWKMKIFFKKLEYHCLVESTKIGNAPFPGRTVILKTNAKANTMGSTKWTYHKKRSFGSNYFIFLRILFQFKNLWMKGWFHVPTTQIAIVVPFVSIGVLFGGAFSLWVSLKSSAQNWQN